MTGGVSFFEVTYNAEKHLWHPHLHILFEGSYIDHAVIKRLWLSTTGDSYICDIRRVGNSAIAAGYIAKYAGKPFDSHILSDPDALDELIQSLRGRRTFNCFGDWRNLGLSKNVALMMDWIPLAPLADLLTKSAQGDPWASKIVRLLKGGSAHVLDLFNDSG